MENIEPKPPQNFRELMALFPSHAEFARRLGCDGDRGRVWYRRGAPPKRLKGRVLLLCALEGIPFSEAEFDRFWKLRDQAPDPGTST